MAQEPAISQTITREHAEAELGYSIDPERWADLVDSIDREGTLHAELSALIFEHLRQSI